MRILRYGGASPHDAQRKKQILIGVLAVFLSLVVIVAAFFAVYAFTRGLAGGDKEPKSTVALQPDATAEMTIAGGDICTLTLPESVDVLDVTFTSSDPKIARVDPSGRVDGISPGTATITAVSDAFSAACKFIVDKAREKTRPAEVTTAYYANVERLNENIEKGGNVYRLIVNRRTDTVTAYTYDDDGNYTLPVRAMVCSCGADGASATPVGDYSIGSKRSWAMLYGDASHPYLYGQYVTEFYGDFLFHSIPYEKRNKATMENEEFNKLGTNASQGCVRLMTADARWIYDNCPENTQVSVIDADASSDPLGTPPAVRQNYNNSWDPTDPNVDNPYLGKLPRILNVEDVSVKKGEEFHPMKGVIARDICGNRITDRVTITGKALTDKPGTYYLTYSVTDDFHLTVAVTRTVVVK